MIICNKQHQWWSLRDKIPKGDFKAILTKSPQFHKDITYALVVNNIPFHKMSYGAGVYKFVKNDGSICDKCLGEGVVK